MTLSPTTITFVVIQPPRSGNETQNTRFACLLRSRIIEFLNHRISRLNFSSLTHYHQSIMLVCAISQLDRSSQTGSRLIEASYSASREAGVLAGYESLSTGWSSTL